jgi:hypothetical protein
MDGEESLALHNDKNGDVGGREGDVVNSRCMDKTSISLL